MPEPLGFDVTSPIGTTSTAVVFVELPTVTRGQDCVAFSGVRLSQEGELGGSTPNPSDFPLSLRPKSSRVGPLPPASRTQGQRARGVDLGVGPLDPVAAPGRSRWSDPRPALVNGQSSKVNGSSIENLNVFPEIVKRIFQNILTFVTDSSSLFWTVSPGPDRAETGPRHIQS